MRIIDLLNNISKGQKVPEIIEYKSLIYNYTNLDSDYFIYDNNGVKHFLFGDLFKDYGTDMFINDNVIIKQNNNYEFEKEEITDINTLIDKVYKLSLKVKELENKE